MCALHAPNTDVASDTDDREAEGSAGVWLFELKDIVNVEAYDLHRRKTPFRDLLSVSDDNFFFICDGANPRDHEVRLTTLHYIVPQNLCFVNEYLVNIGLKAHTFFLEFS